MTILPSAPLSASSVAATKLLAGEPTEIVPSDASSGPADVFAPSSLEVVAEAEADRALGARTESDVDVTVGESTIATGLP